MKEELLMSVRSFQTPTKLLRLLGCFPALRQPLFQYFLDWTQIQNIHGVETLARVVLTPHNRLKAWAFYEGWNMFPQHFLHITIITYLELWSLQRASSIEQKEGDREQLISL